MSHPREPLQSFAVVGEQDEAHCPDIAVPYEGEIDLLAQRRGAYDQLWADQFRPASHWSLRSHEAKRKLRGNSSDRGGVVAWIERRLSFPLLSRFKRRYLDGGRSLGVPRPACG